MLVAVIDGYSTGRVLVEKLLHYGAQCVHVQSREKTNEYYSSTFKPEDYVVDLGFMPDRDKLVARLAELGVTRVLPGTESGVQLADELSEALDTPGNEPALAAASCDKALMAKIASRAGVRIPSGGDFADIESAIHWYRDNRLSSVVVKPVDSAGTDNVFFCTNEDELRAAAERILAGANVYGSANNQFILQERVFGPEYYANTVSYQGEHRVVELWRYVKREVSGVPIYDYEEPVLPADPEWRVLRDFIGGALDVLGIRSGAAHTEVILTEDGPVLIETGARLGGATMPDVVAAYCGHSQADMLASSVVEPAVFHAFDDSAIEWKAILRNVSLCNERSGWVMDDWRTQIEALPTYVALASRLAAGDRIEPTTNLIDAPGYVFLAGEPDAVTADYLALRALEQAGLYTENGARG